MLLAQLPGAAGQGRWKETARGTPTGHDRFRQIFLDHWHRWHDLRLKDEVPPDQRAYLDKIIQRLQLCRDPDGGYALYICPGCQYELRVPSQWVLTYLLQNSILSFLWQSPGG
jgi:hypothetical protein